MSTTKKQAVLFLLSIILCSCQWYHAKPLNIALINPLTANDKTYLANQANCLYKNGLSPILLDFSKPLTPEELAVIAVLVNPDLKAFRAKEDIAYAQVFNAGLLPDPQFNMAMDFPTHPQPGLVVDAYLFGMSWEVSSLITRQAKIDTAKAQQQQVHDNVAWQEWTVANQAELLSEEVYFLEQEVNLTQQAAKHSLLYLNITKQNLLRHDAKIDDFGLRESAYLDFFDQAHTLQRTLDKTRLQLNQILGLNPSEKLPLAVKPLMIPPHLDPEKLFAEAQIDRLDLKALQAGYASQEAQLYTEILGQFPRVNTGINHARDNTAIHSNGFTLNIDIPILNRNQGNIAIAKATREQLWREYTARLQQTRSDIFILTTNLSELRQEELILQQQLPQLVNADRLMALGLKSGNVTVIAYEDVHINLINKQLRLLTLQQEANKQLLALQLALGAYGTY